MAAELNTLLAYDGYMPSEAHIKAQDEIAEHIFGVVARRDGEPMDETRSLAWQRGWAVPARRQAPR
jgi:hypothetical protein